MAYQILLVEDDDKIREIIEDYISAKGNDEYKIISAAEGNTALELIYDKEFDLILLDVMLPGIDGFSLCREIRSMSTVPILFLTAKGQESDILLGYELGCDDYITKPFRVSELFAKVKANVKRAKGMVNENELVCDGIRLNPASGAVYADGEEIKLPPKQYEILKYLMERKGMVISRETLLERIWGYDFEGTDRVVDNQIKNLRHALRASGDMIKTISKKGYKLG